MWREAWQLLRQHWLLLLVLNLAFFGLVSITCATGNSDFDAWFTARMRESAQLGVAQWALTWWGKNFWATVAGIAVINFFVGSLFYLTLPSLVIPGAALPLVLFRAFIWGIISSDWAAQRDYGRLVLVLLEGEAYVLATTAAILHARAWLFPKQVGANRHRDGNWIGLRQNLVMQIFIAVQLVVAAIYETLLITVIDRPSSI